MDFLDLLWTHDLWQLLVTETNRQAENVKRVKPNNYVAKSFQEVTVEEMKAFLGCRISVEMQIDKTRYEQYRRSNGSWLTHTPGFGKVFTRDTFLPIWSMLHCVDENDQNLDKTDKMYKNRPVVVNILDKFCNYYVLKCELSLDEGMIPTKNQLSFKQYIKEKPIKWEIKSFILCKSKTGYIFNVEIYTGRVDIDTRFVETLGNPWLAGRLTRNSGFKGLALYCSNYFNSEGD